MAASQSVSLRVPQRLLEHIDTIAVERFPTRKNGEPNRSRVILDFIEKGIDTVSDNIAPQRQTNSDNIEELIRQQVQFQLQIQQMVRQQLEQYSPSFPAITELQLEIAEIKRILKALVTVDSSNTVSDNSSTISDDRSRPEQPTTASTQPQSATQRQSDRSGPEQSQPATASMQPEPAIQRQPEPLVGDRHQLSDNRDAISNGDDLPEQSKPAAASTPERDRTELSDSLPDIALQQSEPPSRPSQFQPPEPASEQQADRIPPEQTHSTTAETQTQQEFQPQSVAPQRSDHDHPSPTTGSDRIPPEQTHFATAETQAQSALQPESAAPKQSDRDRPSPIDESDRIPPEQLDSATASTQAQSTLQPESAAPPQTNCDRADTVLQPAPEQPHSVTAETQAQSALQPQSTAPAQSERKRADTVLQPVYDPYTPPPETASVSVIAEQKQPMPKPGETYEPGGSGITKNFVKPGENQKPPYGNRIVEISTSDDLLAEIRWCLNNDGDFVFLFEPRNGTPRRAYYLRHERYWEGMRPVKTALVRELIDRRAIWTNDPAKGPGSGCRRFYPTSTAPQSLSDSAPKFSEWMTAKQAFEFLGGNPGDRSSTVNSADGGKKIKFSTFKSKTSSQLKPFGLELSQDRKRQKQPCYRLLKPSDEEILQLIRDLDREFRTDNYLPIFHLREKLQPPLSRDELDRALYRLERNDLIELSALQEVIAYTPEQIDAGIRQNIGGRLFFIMVEDR